MSAIASASIAPVATVPRVAGAVKAAPANRFLGISLNAKRSAPALRASKRAVTAQMSAEAVSSKVTLGAQTLAAAAMTTMACSGDAMAAQEIVGQIAKEGGDARFLAIAALFVPAIGWVGFNILKPGLNQLADMQEQKKSRKAIAAGLGLSAAAMAAFPETADAAQEVVGELAKEGGDARLLAIASLFVPAIGWVGFNILKPGLNQLSEMQEQKKSRKAIATGLGLTAAAMAAFPETADAAQEVVGELAKEGGDARLLAIASLFVPAIGWVGFNILKPGLNQLSEMQEQKKSRKAIATGLGLTAAAMAAFPETADAAQEVVGELAKEGGDARFLAIAALFVPALGWVGFNILKPGLNQFSEMQEQKKSRKAIATGLGLTAAAMAAFPETADAAQEVVGELAKEGGDARFLAIAALFVPALGWVGFNILKPGLNQFSEMQEQKKSRK